ncbi:hypothetical protein PAA26_01360 [Methanomassiliicoccaceae archaeon COG_1]|nr:hypothetical protein [Methanomassiliicoccaceae archaeon COG_1]
MDGLSKTFCITGPDGSSVPLVRISAGPTILCSGRRFNGGDFRV